jgi:excisionase family DNA binding protein
MLFLETPKEVLMTITELLDFKESAQKMKVSIHTLRAWAYQKKIPIVKLGRRTLLRAEDIEKFISKGVIEAREDG